MTWNSGYISSVLTVE